MGDSLRRRLLVTLLLVTLSVWAVVNAAIFSASRTTFDNLFDHNLRIVAETLAQASGHEVLEEVQARASGTVGHRNPHTVDTSRFDDDGRVIAVQMWVFGDALSLRSANAPDTPISNTDSGFSEAQFGGQYWRTYVLRAEDDKVKVIVAERLDQRATLNQSIFVHLIWPQLLAFPVLGLLIWLAVGRSISPLDKIARLVSDRGDNHLRPLDETLAPVEVKPLLHAINDLLGRLDRVLRNERRFTADAAHELRTPLAVIKQQLQVAERAQQTGEHGRALAQAKSGVDRATRLVQQMLTLARLDPEAALGELQPIDLVGVAQEAVADLVPQALDAQVDISLAAPDACLVAGNADALSVMVRNIVENAIRYTPANGQIEVKISDEHGPVLYVDDTGPGIPDSQRDMVLQRFYRQSDVAGGSGLGLSIVRRLAELHRAKLVLGDSPAGGLRVRVAFAQNGGCGAEQTG
jgi:two-component system sensor histidine kinase QseC